MGGGGANELSTSSVMCNLYCINVISAVVVRSLFIYKVA